MAGRCFWTKSASCRHAPRPNCCASFRRANCGASAKTPRGASTSASSRRPTAIFDREVSEGRFRLDLLYRLDVVRLAVPPLRDRRDDITMLAGYFWREATERVASRAVLAVATVAALTRYDWPGNVRELQNVLAALAVRVPRRGVVTPSTLPPQFGQSPAADACRLDAARRHFEERFVRAALVRMWRAPFTRRGRARRHAPGPDQTPLTPQHFLTQVTRVTCPPYWNWTSERAG